ncbi:hypothetical protein SASPL_101889 [Salvia splendens]|uniref:Retrotransposon Copia-like N-terminal domain-containing protein n=1 Tax=Salvia splendens TaxID=180675 RepID=A0A8X9ABM2_SALSN|nr:hypothetical protein SASPL_101889 [Salvia splendens]
MATKTIESVSIGIKLDGNNFPVWSRLMRITIGGRELLDHLEGDIDPPKKDDPKFKSWQAEDYVVFSWLIQNMEQRLVLQFAQHQTAAAIWRSLATTFGARKDPVQIYDLEDRTNKLVQGTDTLEAYWAELQNLWVGMDNRKPCPYTCCDKGVKIYQTETKIKRLHQFLSGVNNKYDGLRRELLKEDPAPDAETGLGILKQEEERSGIWRQPLPPDSGIGAGFGIRDSNRTSYGTPGGGPTETATGGWWAANPVVNCREAQPTGAKANLAAQTSFGGVSC